MSAFDDALTGLRSATRHILLLTGTAGACLASCVVLWSVVALAWPTPPGAAKAAPNDMVFPGFSPDVAHQGIPGLDGPRAELFINNDVGSPPPAHSPVVSSLRVRRNLTYSGGVNGAVYAGMQSVTTLGPDVKNTEWSILGVAQDRSTSAPVGIYGKYEKLAPRSSGWAATFEARDSATPPGGRPAGGLVGLEVDAFGEGLDPAGTRVGATIVAGHDRPTKEPMAASTGLQIGPQGGCGQCRFDTALKIYGAGTRALDLSGSAAPLGLALAEGQTVEFGPAGPALRHRGGALVVERAGATLLSQRDGGGLQLHALADDPDRHEGEIYYNARQHRLRLAGASTWADLVTASVTAPANATASCDIGQISIGRDYLYVCVASNRWRRSRLADF